MAIQLPSPVVPTVVVAAPRQYPHVDAIPEWATQQSVRLAWDSIHTLEEKVVALQATQNSILAAFSTLLTAVEQIQILAEQAYAKTQEP